MRYLGIYQPTEHSNYNYNILGVIYYHLGGYIIILIDHNPRTGESRSKFGQKTNQDQMELHFEIEHRAAAHLTPQELHLPKKSPSRSPMSIIPPPLR